jgi:hypothetical protein
VATGRKRVVEMEGVIGVIGVLRVSLGETITILSSEVGMLSSRAGGCRR